MNVVEIVGGILLLLSCLLLIVFCLFQDQKSDQNMASAITGTMSDSHFSKNEGRTKEAILKKWTLWLSILFFLSTLIVTIIPVYFFND